MTDPREVAQREDDVFRDKLLGSECFCGAGYDMQRTKLPDGTLVIVESRCLPLKCLAHGFCAAHLTPVSVQMTDDDKARIAKRMGVKAWLKVTPTGAPV